MKLLNFLINSVPSIKVTISPIDDDHVLITTKNGKETRNIVAIVFSEMQIQKLDELKMKLAHSGASSSYYSY